MIRDFLTCYSCSYYNSMLLLIIRLEALFREIRPACPEELLYADDLVLVSETLEDLKGRLES